MAEQDNLENVEKTIELYNKLENNIKEYYSIAKELSEARGGCTSWRNTKIEYWRDIVNKYGKENLLNAYGDIFYIVKKENIDGVVTYTGKRVLWNLGLSKELYHIEEITETDEDVFVCTDYDVYYWCDDE